AFVLGHDPTRRIVCASYAQDLTAKHARDCRNVIESAWYKQLFPRTRIDPRKNTELEFETTARGGRLGTSVGGTLTGRGGNLILIDDPMKPSEAMSETRRAAVKDWYDSTLSSRLDHKTEGAIVLIMQRLHVDDLVGHVLGKGTPWTVLNLPAIAEDEQEIEIGPGRTYKRGVDEILHPDHEPLSVLEDLKATMGSAAFSAQYQQRPVPPEGALVKRGWFRAFAKPPEKQKGDQIVQSWDTASKADRTSDFSVCSTWLKKGKEYYLLDVLRVRLEYPDLRRKILSQSKHFGADLVLIEDASSGASLSQDLRREPGIYVKPIKPEGDKIVRLEARTAVIEAGHVWLPESAPWLADFLDEILAFPGGRFDDQVDSFSQFLTWAARPRVRINIG
ncbi:MAG: phage terminase large subunit, partial [Sandaracinus sp.]|nr:phage terminase large subunit [Sandaracinus sp.]